MDESQIVVKSASDSLMVGGDIIPFVLGFVLVDLTLQTNNKEQQPYCLSVPSWLDWILTWMLAVYMHKLFNLQSYLHL